MYPYCPQNHQEHSPWSGMGDIRSTVVTMVENAPKERDEMGNNVSQERELKHGGCTPGTAETQSQACTSLYCSEVPQYEQIKLLLNR